MTSGERDEVMSFGVIVAAGALTVATLGWKAIIGFVFGVCATFIAAAIASNGDFE